MEHMKDIVPRVECATPSSLAIGGLGPKVLRNWLAGCHTGNITNAKTGRKTR